MRTLLLSAALATSTFTLAGQLAANDPPQLRKIIGPVQVIHEGQSQDAQEGTPLATGDTVRTGEGATALIQLDGRTRLKLNAKSALKVGPEPMLEEGSVFAHVRRMISSDPKAPEPRKFSIRAGAMSLGVRGTEFFVSWNKAGADADRDLWMCVHEGKVAVTGQKVPELLVPAGKGVKIAKGATPGQLASFKWTESLNWNLDPSAGDIVNSPPQWKKQ